MAFYTGYIGILMGVFLIYFPYIGGILPIQVLFFIFCPAFSYIQCFPYSKNNTFLSIHYFLNRVYILLPRLQCFSYIYIGNIAFSYIYMYQRHPPLFFCIFCPDFLYIYYQTPFFLYSLPRLYGIFLIYREQPFSLPRLISLYIVFSFRFCPDSLIYRYKTLFSFCTLPQIYSILPRLYSLIYRHSFLFFSFSPEKCVCFLIQAIFSLLIGFAKKYDIFLYIYQEHYLFCPIYNYHQRKYVFSLYIYII